MRTLSAAFALALFVSSSTAAPVPRDAVLFALQQWPDGHYSLVPVLALHNGALREPAVADSGTGCREFPPAYSRAGRSYTLLYGGAKAGTVTLRGRDPIRVSLDRALALQRVRGLEGEMALATDAPALARSEGNRRAANAAERRAALDLARAQFSRNGVAAPLLTRTHAAHLTSTDVNRDGRADLIGAFQIDAGSGRVHTLFLIAEGEGAFYTVSHARYHFGGGESFEFEYLADHVDLNGDGADEIITRDSGWEGYRWRVYAKRGKAWARTFEGFGCEGI